MKRMMVVLGAVMVAGGLFAETFTWVGPMSGGKMNVADFWQNSQGENVVPSGDNINLVFSNNATTNITMHIENDLADSLAVSSIRASLSAAASSATGSALIFTKGKSIKLVPASAEANMVYSEFGGFAFQCPIVLDKGTAEKGQSRITCARGYLSFYGTVSGEGGLWLHHEGTSNVSFYFYAANSTFKGEVYIDGGQLVAGANDAVGVGKIVTRCDAYPHRALNIAKDISICNEIYLGPESAYGGAIYFSDGAKLTGKFHLSKGANQTPRTDTTNWRMNSSASVTFNNEVVQDISGGLWVIQDNGAKYTFNKKVTGKPKVYLNRNATVIFNDSGNDFGYLQWTGDTDGGVIRLNAENCLLNPCDVYFSNPGANKGYGELDLCGHDVTVLALFDNGDFSSTPANRRRVTSAKPATLTICGVSGNGANRNFGGSFNDQLSLNYATQSTTYKDYVLTTSTSTMSGKLTVTSGNLYLRNGASFPNVSAIEVKAGAKLVVESTAAINANIHEVKVGDGAVLSLPEDITVGTYWVGDGNGGYVQAEGDGKVYTTAGTGKITAYLHAPSAETQAVTWTAQGASDAFLVAGNWSDTPNFSSKSVCATFANAGTTATVDAEVALKGIVFGIASGFTIAGENTITLYEGGIDVQGAATYVISAPLYVGFHQDWKIAEGATLEVSALTGTDEFGASCVNVSGKGSLALSGEDGDYSGKLVVANAKSEFSGEPFGDATGDELVLDNANGGMNVFAGVTISKPIRIIERAEEFGSYTMFNSAENTENVFNGKIYAENNNVRLIAKNGSTMRYCGGMEDAGVADHNRFVLSGDVATTLHRIENTPVTLSHLCMDSNANVELAVAGNQFDVVTLGTADRSFSSHLKLGVENAVSRLDMLHLHGANAKLDLNGHSITIGKMNCSGGSVIASATEANLTLVASGYGFYSVIEGPINLISKNNSVGNYINLWRSMPKFTGTLTVDNSHLSIEGDYELKNLKRVEIVNGGTFYMRGNKSVGRNTDIYCKKGRFSLNTGRVISVRNLYFGDSTEPVPQGTYGNANSGAEHTEYASYFVDTANGMLRVRGNPGVVIFFN